MELSAAYTLETNDSSQKFIVRTNDSSQKFVVRIFTINVNIHKIEIAWHSEIKMCKQFYSFIAEI
jgi:hypothetical protein